MKQIIKSKFFPVALLSLIAILVFLNLPNTFYQQDEWKTLGNNLAAGMGIFANISPLQLLFGELRPFSGLMYLIFLGFYKFTVVPTAIFGIVFGIINSLITFYLAEKITKKRLIAFIASVFLITDSVSHQAVTWASAVSTLPAVTLILTAIIMHLKYFDTNNKKYLAISFISAILSLYFKGIGLFLFILFPLMFFIYKRKSILRKKNLEDMLRINFPLLIFGVLTFMFRFWEVFFRTEKIAGFASGAGNSDFVQTVLFRLFLYPVTSLFQAFVPSLDLYSITPIITKIQYKFLANSPLTDLISQTIVADMASIVGAFAILGLLGFVMYKSKDKIMNRNILFILLFFFLSFLPYIVLDRGSAYLESRYSYLGAVGAGILLGYIVYFFVSINKYFKWVTIFLVFVFLFHQASIIRKDIDYQVVLGDQRKAVLNGIRSNYPKLSDKNIFYVTSDKGYYGDITNPFQNGLGYVLEVYYYDSSGKIPKDFLIQGFLWDLGSEGYKEKGNLGFGYFQDLDKMVKVMQEDKLSASTIHAFFIDSSTMKIVNITDSIKAQVSTVSGVLK